MISPLDAILIRALSKGPGAFVVWYPPGSDCRGEHVPLMPAVGKFAICTPKDTTALDRHPTHIIPEPPPFAEPKR